MLTIINIVQNGSVSQIAYSGSTIKNTQHFVMPTVVFLRHLRHLATTLAHTGGAVDAAVANGACRTVALQMEKPTNTYHLCEIK